MRPDVTLQIDLQEGFSGEAVTVRLDGQDHWQTPGARTRLQIGLADSFAMDVAPGQHRLEVQVPARDLQTSVDLNIESPCWVGIELTRTGELTARVSETAFRYA